MVRERCGLHILTWKCASHHKGMQLFISHLTTWLRTRRFSKPTFRPSGASNHWENTVFRDFPALFAHLHILSPHSAFPSVHIVGSLTPKLTSMKETVYFPNQHRAWCFADLLKGKIGKPSSNISSGICWQQIYP